jgi:ABC-2 type transport system permease protein
MPTATVPDQAAVFRRLRSRLIRNTLGVMLKTGKVRLFTILFSSALVAAFVFAVGWIGFGELFGYNVPAKGIIIGSLFDLMFFTLGSMLLLSTGIILYASLFTSPEAKYLLSTPALADRIFAAKFLAAVGFSSWAFLVLGMPILVSYGMVAGVPWYYYPLLPVALFGFVLLPGSVSALACLLMVRYLPRNRKQVLLLVGVVLIAVVGFWLTRLSLAAKKSLASGRPNDVEGLFDQFALTRNPLTPSHWMTESVMAAARPIPDDPETRTAATREKAADVLTPLALLWSNGMLAYLAAAFAARRLYRTGFDRIAGGGRGKKVYAGNPLDRLMEGLVFYLSKPTRVLIVKDFRTFRRDPTQWVLLFIFAGLLLLGASNFRQYYGSDLGLLDKYVLSLVNLAGLSILLCAGLSRFVFPLISLEGRKFWILGLTPVTREQILFGKFAFSATGATVIALTLTLVGDVLLAMPPLTTGIHLLTALAVAVGLSGLNVGLGAYLPNFRETDPSKIVSGFGGTVNMVAGLAFLLFVVGTMTVPIHAATLAKKLQGGADELPGWAFAGIPVGLAATVLGVWLPLRAGARALRRTEF